MTDPTKTDPKTPDPKPGEAPKAPKAIARKNPRWVKAIARGHYGQIREPGDVFENTRDLSASWFVEAKEPKPAADE